MKPTERMHAPCDSWQHDKLREAAHATAIRTELTPQFPGVDIDAIHYKLGAVNVSKESHER